MRIQQSTPRTRQCPLVALVVTVGLLVVVDIVSPSVVQAFAPSVVPSSPRTTTLVWASGAWGGKDVLFEDEPELMDVAENFLRTKYQQIVGKDGDAMSVEQCATALRTLLPPVSPEELETEVTQTLERIKETSSDTSSISKECFVKAVAQNSYWQQAGDLVVMELMYFEALFAYYQTGKSLLNNDDYEQLKESLTWEGSSIATMNKQEALFVTAVASSRRGTPYLDDKEYADLKSELKSQKSWVTARGEDALEKLGLDTFMGYLHRAL